jgi:hypothetical protein
MKGMITSIDLLRLGQSQQLHFLVITMMSMMVEHLHQVPTSHPHPHSFGPPKGITACSCLIADCCHGDDDDNDDNDGGNKNDEDCCGNDGGSWRR